MHPQGNIIHYVGCYGGNVNASSACLDGSMSHCHFADGQQYDASVFGSTMLQLENGKSKRHQL